MRKPVRTEQLLTGGVNTQLVYSCKLHHCPVNPYFLRSTFSIKWGDLHWYTAVHHRPTSFLLQSKVNLIFSKVLYVHMLKGSLKMGAGGTFFWPDLFGTWLIPQNRGGEGVGKINDFPYLTGWKDFLLRSDWDCSMAIVWFGASTYIQEVNKHCKCKTEIMIGKVNVAVWIDWKSIYNFV